MALKLVICMKMEGAILCAWGLRAMRDNLQEFCQESFLFSLYLACQPFVLKDVLTQCKYVMNRHHLWKKGFIKCFVFMGHGSTHWNSSTLERKAGKSHAWKQPRLLVRVHLKKWIPLHFVLDKLPRGIHHLPTWYYSIHLGLEHTVKTYIVSVSCGSGTGLLSQLLGRLRQGDGLSS